MTAEAAAPDAKNLGIFQRLMAKGLATLTPAERVDMLRDAAVTSSAAITKADELLRGTTDSKTHVIEDQWDGPPDDHLETKHTGGPDSAPEAGGKANVGSPQAASGDGATKMVREYSRFATQSGVQAATERLGAELSGMRKAVLQTLNVIKAMNTRMDLLSTSVLDTSAIDASVAKALTPAALDAAIAKALATALPKAVAKAVKTAKVVAKAEEEEEEEGKDGEEEEEEEEMDKSETEDVKIQVEEEEEEKAKALLTEVRGLLTKSLNASLDGKPKTARKHGDAAVATFAKAKAVISKAGAGKISVATVEMAKAIAKALPKSQAENQDKWPNSDDKPAGSGGTVTKAELEKIAVQVAKAAEGVAMLSTNVNGLMTAIGGQSRGSGLPPVVEMMRGQPDAMIAKSAKIEELREQNVITDKDADTAIDLLGQLQRAPAGDTMERIVKSRIERLPPVVKAVFETRDAA